MSPITGSRNPSSVHGLTIRSAAMMGCVRLKAYQPLSSGSGPRGGLVAPVVKVPIEYVFGNSSLVLLPRLLLDNLMVKED